MKGKKGFVLGELTMKVVIAIVVIIVVIGFLVKIDIVGRLNTIIPGFG